MHSERIWTGIPPQAPEPRSWRRRLWGVVGWLLVCLEVLLVLGAAAGFGLVYGAYRSVSKILPTAGDIAAYQPPAATTIYASNGEVIGRIFHEDRELVPLEGIPPQVRNATVAIEDRRFYHHPGIDLRGIIRALYRNLRAQEVQEGASTITQQLARSVYLSQKRTVARKLQEMVLATELERRYSKDEILQMYLNQIYYGNLAYGIAAGSRRYFGKRVDQLTLVEAALLAGMPRNPSAYSPYRHPNAARARRNLVLAEMAEQGYISRRESRAAQREPIEVIPSPPAGIFSFKYPYFTTAAVSELVRRLGEAAAYAGGLQVHTTLHPEVQKVAEETLALEIAAARGRRVSAGAAVVMNPRTGEIRALAGGLGFTPHDQFNRATQARRQAGSAFKPFVYTAAIEQGWSPGSAISGASTTIRVSADESWTVRNAGGGGTYTLASALAHSINAAAANLIMRVGPAQVVKVAHRLGIQSPLQPVPSLALGSQVVTPLEMGAAFCPFANGGLRVEPTVIARVLDPSGVAILDGHAGSERVLSRRVAYVMNEMLQGVVRFGTGRQAQGLGAPTAGKTGTSDDYRDAWFIGFTPRLLAAVWVGNDDNSPTAGVFGGTLPCPIWRKIMEPALKILDSQGGEFPGPGPEKAPRRPQAFVATTSEQTKEQQPGELPAAAGAATGRWPIPPPPPPGRAGPPRELVPL